MQLLADPQRPVACGINSLCGRIFSIWPRRLKSTANANGDSSLAQRFYWKLLTVGTPSSLSDDGMRNAVLDLIYQVSGQWAHNKKQPDWLEAPRANIETSLGSNKKVLRVNVSIYQQRQHSRLQSSKHSNKTITRPHKPTQCAILKNCERVVGINSGKTKLNAWK